MTAQNLSVIFSAVLFQSQEQLPIDPRAFFGKSAADNTSLEMYKNDRVIADLITYADQIFKGKHFPLCIDNFSLSVIPDNFSPSELTLTEGTIEKDRKIPNITR